MKTATLDVRSPSDRRVSCDVKAVGGNITTLISAGVLSRADGGEIEFPFEAVKVEQRSQHEHHH